MFRRSKTPSNNTFKTESSSFNRTKNIMSPNRTTHLQLAETTAKLKQSNIIKPKKLLLPSLSKSNTYGVQMEYSLEQYKLENKQLIRKNILLQGQISQLRILVQSNLKQKQEILLKRISDISQEMNRSKIQYQTQIMSYKQVVQILKQTNLNFLNESKVQNISILCQQIASIAQLRRSVQSINTQLSQPLGFDQKKIIIYDKLLYKKCQKIRILSQSVSYLTSILNSIRQLIDKSESDYSILPGKLQYILKHKQQLTSTQIATLQNQMVSERQLLNAKQQQIQAIKIQFSERIRQVSVELNSIIQNTKKQFDSLKVQNWALLQQNRQLKKNNFKSKESIKPQQTVRSMNSQSLSQSQPQFMIRKKQSPIVKTKSTSIKTGLIKTFSNWIYEWSHTRTWENRIAMLQLLLDRQQILQDGVSKSMNQLANLLYDCLLNSKNTQVQSICITILAKQLQIKILHQSSLHIQRILPLIINSHPSNQQHTIKILYNYIECKQLDQNSLDAVTTSKLLDVLIFNIRNNQLVKQSYIILSTFIKKNKLIKQMNECNISDMIVGQLKEDNQRAKQILKLLIILLNNTQYIQYLRQDYDNKHQQQHSQSILKQYNILFSFINTNNQSDALECIHKLFQIPQFIVTVDKLSLMTMLVKNLQNYPQLLSIIHYILQSSAARQYQELLQSFNPLIETIHKQNNFPLLLKILAKVKNTSFDQSCIKQLLILLQTYDKLGQENRNSLLKLIKTILDRNKQIVCKYLQGDTLTSLIKIYLSSSSPDGLIASLINMSIDSNRSELSKCKNQILSKMIQNVNNQNNKVRTLTLKGLVQIAKQKQSSKLISISNTIKLFSQLNQIKDEQSASLILSLTYFLTSNPGYSEELCICFMPIIIKTISLFSDSKSIILKSLTLLEKMHLNNNRKYILNQLAEQSQLLSLNAINQFLITTNNKKQMADHAIFLYESLNNPIPVESLAKNISKTKKSLQMVEQLMKLDKQYTSIGSDLGKIVQKILTEMARFNDKIKNQIERLKNKNIFEL